MGANPSALVKLYNEFAKKEPQARNGGIYANKSGYHNTRANHLRHRPGDYSIQAAADKRGPSNKAAALDITFNDARYSRFHTIAKYTTRLINAMKRKDSRLYYKGSAVVRECFGNSDLDRQVEGWSLYRGYALSSDPSHLWHIHISFHREFVENWAAVSGVLDVLLDRDSDEKDWFDLASKKDLKDAIRDVVGDAVWSHKLPAVDDSYNYDMIPAATHLRYARHHAREARYNAADAGKFVWTYQLGKARNPEETTAAATSQRWSMEFAENARDKSNHVLDSLGVLFEKFDSLATEMRDRLDSLEGRKYPDGKDPVEKSDS